VRLIDGSWSSCRAPDQGMAGWFDRAPHRTRLWGWMGVEADSHTSADAAPPSLQSGGWSRRQASTARRREVVAGLESCITYAPRTTSQVLTTRQEGARSSEESGTVGAGQRSKAQARAKARRRWLYDNGSQVQILSARPTGSHLTCGNVDGGSVQNLRYSARTSLMHQELVGSMARGPGRWWSDLRG
jgi:hypothetical protein